MFVITLLVWKNTINVSLRLIIIKVQAVEAYSRVAEKMVVRIANLRTADGATSWDRKIASAKFIVIFHQKTRFYWNNHLSAISFPNYTYYLSYQEIKNCYLFPY